MTVKQRLGEDFWLRCLCFLLCIPSGAALLAKMFGLSAMQPVIVFIFLPSAIALTLIWYWARRSSRIFLADALVIGFWGGLLGTVAYDLIRIPFLLMGQRVFVPIRIYGIWVYDATLSSRQTDLVGWSYHFSNGISFGIMYALFMARRHWFWAIVWAFFLETIAILSPFSTIFNLSGNYYAIAVAYLGHIAYGIPLGWLVYRWDETRRWIKQSANWRVPAFFVVVAAYVLVMLLWPPWVQRDRQASAGTLRVVETRLNPDIVRIDRGKTVTVHNPEAAQKTLVNRSAAESHLVRSGDALVLPFEDPGIFQTYLETTGRTRSSFVIVEPVQRID